MNTIDNSVEVEQGYRDTCAKCGGDGRWKGFGDCTGDMRCTMCNGAGFKMFKTSSDERAKAREAAARAKAKKEAELRERAEQWFAAHPAEAAWMRESAEGFEFAQSMIDAVNAYGHLTERQEAAVRSATEKAGLSQARALITSNGIGKYGSVSNPAPNGLTYEQALQVGEQSYQRRRAARTFSHGSGRGARRAPGLSSGRGSAGRFCGLSSRRARLDWRAPNLPAATRPLCPPERFGILGGLGAFVVAGVAGP